MGFVAGAPSDPATHYGIYIQGICRWPCRCASWEGAFLNITTGSGLQG